MFSWFELLIQDDRCQEHPGARARLRIASGEGGERLVYDIIMQHRQILLFLDFWVGSGQTESVC
jgi:hypothetical protein